MPPRPAASAGPAAPTLRTGRSLLYPVAAVVVLALVAFRGSRTLPPRDRDSAAVTPATAGPRPAHGSDGIKSSAAAALPAGAGVKFAVRELFGDTEVVWQRPASPTGTLLLFHGCSHGAADWFAPGPGCPSCLGLPEEGRVARAALAKGLAAVAISSADRAYYRCWAIRRGSVDMKAVKRVLEGLLPREGLSGLPLFAFGASSGGAFALALAAEVPFSGICSEIMAARRIGDIVATARTAHGGAFPPVAFVHMPRDGGTAQAVRSNVEDLGKLGVPTRVWEVNPVPVTAAWLAESVPGIGEARAAAVVAALTKEGLLSGDGKLQFDPRQSDWRIAVAAAPGCADLPLSPDASPLSEFLNVAWAVHELVGGPAGEVLDWLLLQWKQGAGGLGSAKGGAAAADKGVG